MQLQTYPWEHTLLALAHEARTATSTQMHHSVDAQLLNRAYDYCDALTAVHSRSFHLASGLLPADKRRSVRALYAFCRVSDDTVDQADMVTGEATTNPDNIDVRMQALAAWRRTSLSINPPPADLVSIAWADTRLRYHIPLRYAEQLLDGVAVDLYKSRYATFEELAAYSYGVASTVGLMSMHIIGFSGPEALPYAIKLGVALQLTNILRDVAEDWQRGRVYLPQSELDDFGVTEEDLAAGRLTDSWRAFMRFQIERNRRLYAESLPGITCLDAGGRFAITAAADLYAAILDDIEQHDYDVFSRRSYVSRWGKLRRLPAIWWRSRTLGIA